MGDSIDLPYDLTLSVETDENSAKYFKLDTPESDDSLAYEKTNTSNNIDVNSTHMFIFRLVIDLDNRAALHKAGHFMDSSDISFEDARLKDWTDVPIETKRQMIYLALSNLFREYRFLCGEGLSPLQTHFNLDYRKALENYVYTQMSSANFDMSKVDDFVEAFEDYWVGFMQSRVDMLKDKSECVDCKNPHLSSLLLPLDRVDNQRLNKALREYSYDLLNFQYEDDSWLDVLMDTKEWISDNRDGLTVVVCKRAMRDLLLDKAMEFRKGWDFSESKEETKSNPPKGRRTEKAREFVEEYSGGSKSEDTLRLKQMLGGKIGSLRRERKVTNDLTDEDKDDIMEAIDVYEEFLDEVRENPNNQGSEDDLPDNMFYCTECDSRHYQNSMKGYNHRGHGEGIDAAYYKMEGDDWSWAIPAMSEKAAKMTAEVAIGEEPESIEEVDVTDEVLQTSVKKIGDKSKEMIAKSAGVSMSDFFVFNPPIDYPTIDEPLIYMGGAVSITAEDRDVDLDEDKYMMCHVNNETLWIMPEARIGDENSSDLKEMVPEDAIEDYEEFNNEEHDAVSEVEISLPSDESRWNDLGEVTSEVYTSDKEGLGEDQRYIHHHDEDDKPRLYNLDDIYVVAGGAFKVSDWVYD